MQVHQSALRASKVRQEQLDAKQQQLRSPSPAFVRRSTHFDDAMGKETSGWQTEYGGHFRPHSADIYRRNFRSQMAVPRCYDIRYS